MSATRASKLNWSPPWESFGASSDGNDSEINILLGTLDWESLNLNPLSVCRKFFELPLKGRFVGVFQQLNHSKWKGLATQWPVWDEGPECQLRIDKNLVLLLLQQSLGDKDDDEDFSCRSMTDLEKEVLENLIQELVEHVNINIEDLATNEANSEYSDRLVHLVWSIKVQSQEQYQYQEQLAKIAISVPLDCVPSNFSFIDREAVRNEEDCSQVTIKLDLEVGNSKMTLSDLSKLEKEDFIFLEESDKNSLKILGMNDLADDFPRVVPVVIGPRKIDSKWHKIKLDDNNIQEIKRDMNQALNNDVLSDFPVDVKAEFKDVKMTLKDLFALQSGWVLPIEQIAENELLLTSQGKIIAKGELVVTGDKFGILIKEVLLNEN